MIIGPPVVLLAIGKGPNSSAVLIALRKWTHLVELGADNVSEQRKQWLVNTLASNSQRTPHMYILHFYLFWTRARTNLGYSSIFHN